MKKNFRLLYLILIGLLIYSCQNDDDFIKVKQENLTTKYDDTYKYGQKIILGKKLKNPYSVENMELALNNLINSGKYSGINRITTISTTHYYVKFKPQNTDELKLIENDTTLILYDYPLDYEILQMGDYYRDPSISVTKPTYLYASVKVDQSINTTVDYEILANLFIPDEEDISDSFTNLLVDESLILTNNLSDNETNRPSKWRPAGRIRVWDDVIGSHTTSTQVFSHWEYFDCNTGETCNPNDNDDGIELDPIGRLPEPCCKRAVYNYVSNTSAGSYISMEGVKVRARRWFTTHTGITNSQGYYSCDGRFRRKANYKIKWKRHNFSIWWSWLSSAKYNGPKKKGDWNLNIKGGHQGYYATIFRGAHLYYYGNMFGLTRPKHQTTLGGRLIINAKKESATDSYSHERSLVFGADILLKEWGNPTDQVFGTTIHELAHAAHREVDNYAYNSLKWKAYVNPWFSLGQTWQNPGPTGRSAKRVMETWQRQ